jgi:hypothetical protein
MPNTMYLHHTTIESFWDDARRQPNNHSIPFELFWGHWAVGVVLHTAASDRTVNGRWRRRAQGRTNLVERRKKVAPRSPAPSPQQHLPPPNFFTSLFLLNRHHHFWLQEVIDRSDNYSAPLKKSSPRTRDAEGSLADDETLR